MIACMASPASKTAAGSVGTVATQFLDLPRPLALDCGRELHPVRVAYETYGALSPRRDNVILVCHALSASAHVAGKYTEDEDEKPGWWDGLVGYGKGIDLEKYFVVCVNLPGSPFGTTAPHSIDPGTGNDPLGTGFNGDFSMDFANIVRGCNPVHGGVNYLNTNCFALPLATPKYRVAPRSVVVLLRPRKRD